MRGLPKVIFREGCRLGGVTTHAGLDQLGNGSPEIRLGGIYALERIARESEEDHWPIMEVLTAYVRQHAPWRPAGGQRSEAIAAIEKKSVDNPTGKSEPTELPNPDPDIQAIMTVLRRRTRSFGHGESEPLGLQGTNLPGADLREANLSGATLRKANVSEANLSGATLRRVDLSEAYLRRAHLSGADLESADLSGTNLMLASLSKADLRGANLWGAENLIQAQLDEKTGIGDENTILPPDLKPPAHWNVKTDEQIEGN